MQWSCVGHGLRRGAVTVQAASETSTLIALLQAVQKGPLFSGFLVNNKLITSCTGSKVGNLPNYFTGVLFVWGEDLVAKG